MSKDEYLITDAPLKALTVFAKKAATKNIFCFFLFNRITIRGILIMICNFC